MILFATILTWLVGLEHLYIAWLEMKAGVDKQAETFNLPTTYLQQPEAKVSMANQGIPRHLQRDARLIAAFDDIHLPRRDTTQRLADVDQFRRRRCFLWRLDGRKKSLAATIAASTLCLDRLDRFKAHLSPIKKSMIVCDHAFLLAQYQLGLSPCVPGLPKPTER